MHLDASLPLTAMQASLSALSHRDQHLHYPSRQPGNFNSRLSDVLQLCLAQPGIHCLYIVPLRLPKMVSSLVQGRMAMYV